MKNKKIKFISSALLLSLMLVTATSVLSSASELTNSGGSGLEVSVEDLNEDESNVQVIESTEESFVKSFAESEEISYDEAKEINDMNTESLGLGKARSADEVAKYVTVQGTQSVKGTAVKTVIALEVKAVYNRATGKYTSFASFANPYIRVAGTIVSGVWSGSSPNKELSSTRIRISYTGSVYVGVTSTVGAQLGVEGFSFSNTVGSTQYYYSPVVTQVLLKYPSSL